MSESASLPRYRPGIADLLFVLVALMVLRGARHTLLDDPGLGWHIRNIDAMLTQGGWLTIDPFTDPRSQLPPRWYSNQWLGEVPYWLGWKWAGLEGIACVNALAIAFVAGLLYRMLLADGLIWPMALMWTALGTMGTSCSWNARPNVFSILFVLVVARVCVRLHEGRLSRRAGLGVPVLFTLWANTHGGFVAGLILLGATFLIELGIVLAGEEEARRSARRTVVHAGLLLVAALMATLVNPYGVDLYRWVFLLLGDPFFMTLHQEWRSPDFQSAGAVRYLLLIILFPVVVALSHRRPNLIELGLSVLWLYLALKGFRYVALWVVVAVPLMARSSVAIPYLHEVARRMGLSADPGGLYFTPAGRVSWVCSILLALALFGGAKMIQGRLAMHNQEIIASQGLDRFLDLMGEWRVQNGRRPRIYHDYKWGGYLTWHGWPEVLNWIDDRNEVQGKEHIQNHIGLESGRVPWQDGLAEIDLVCIDPTTTLAERLAGEPNVWQERHRDAYAVLFERRRDR